MPNAPYFALLTIAIAAVGVLGVACFALARWIRRAIDLEDLEER